MGPAEEACLMLRAIGPIGLLIAAAFTAYATLNFTAGSRRTETTSSKTYRVILAESPGGWAVVPPSERGAFSIEFELVETLEREGTMARGRRGRSAMVLTDEVRSRVELTTIGLDPVQEEKALLAKLSKLGNIPTSLSDSRGPVPFGVPNHSEASRASAVATAMKFLGEERPDLVRRLEQNELCIVTETPWFNSKRAAIFGWSITSLLVLAAATMFVTRRLASDDVARPRGST